MKDGLYTNRYGTKIWYLNDKRHREDGPAVEYASGDKVWYINGKYHREDGPAIEYAIGNKSWYLNGKLHREDGPAIEYASGNKYWWLNGRHVDKYTVLDTLEKQEEYVLMLTLEAL